MKTRMEIYNEAVNLTPGWKDEGKSRMAGDVWIDDAFGEMIDLKSKNMYNDTVIIVMNDHGKGSKNMLVEHGTRIINFIRYPPEFGKNGYMLPSDFVVNTEDVASVILI